MRLTVRTQSPYTIFGPRYRAMAHFRTHGFTTWVRGDGSAVAYWTDDEGKKRQRTYHNVIISNH